jgi:hypothetical protein
VELHVSLSARKSSANVTKISLDRHATLKIGDYYHCSYIHSDVAHRQLRDEKIKEEHRICPEKRPEKRFDIGLAINLE